MVILSDDFAAVMNGPLGRTVVGVGFVVGRAVMTVTGKPVEAGIPVGTFDVGATVGGEELAGDGFAVGAAVGLTVGYVGTPVGGAVGKRPGEDVVAFGVGIVVG